MFELHDEVLFFETGTVGTITAIEGEGLFEVTTEDGTTINCTEFDIIPNDLDFESEPTWDLNEDDDLFEDLQPYRNMNAYYGD